MAETPDFLAMSDEDFLEQNPTVLDVPAEPVVPDETPAEHIDGEVEGLHTPVEETVVEETHAERPAKAPKAQVTKPKVKPEAASPQETPEGANPDGEQTDDDEAEETEETETEGGGTDYAAFYDRVMAPFKANGKTIELKTPEEVIQLMQMGANYTKKMQELVPQRKLLTMLQSNGLADEGKLSYLIDLDKKNPEAIKKLIKDAGIDPLDIDTSVAPAYHEGNHRVSDEAVAFVLALEDMQSSPEQRQTLATINGDWDHASKDALWKNPEIMKTIHQQRENGIYGRITGEIDRRKTLGQIPANVPFLQAYKVIGDELTAANAFADLNLNAPKPLAKLAQPTVVATRVAAPKAVVKNNDRAAAASSTRSAPAKGKGEPINHLAMSDEDFLKLDQFNGRL